MHLYFNLASGAITNAHDPLLAGVSRLISPAFTAGFVLPGYRPPEYRSHMLQTINLLSRGVSSRPVPHLRPPFQSGGAPPHSKTLSRRRIALKLTHMRGYRDVIRS